jgi:hypothetical protein
MDTGCKAIQVGIGCCIVIGVADVKHFSVSIGVDPDPGDVPIPGSEHREAGSIMSPDIDACVEMGPAELPKCGCDGVAGIRGPEVVREIRPYGIVRVVGREGRENDLGRRLGSGESGNPEEEEADCKEGDASSKDDLPD